MKRYVLDGELAHSTDWVAEREQLDYWNEHVCQEFVHLKCASNNDRPSFRGNIYTATCGDLQFAEIRSEAQRVSRDRSQVCRYLDDHFYLNLQLAGKSYNAQHSASSILSPGDLVLLDTTRPFTMDFHGDFAQLSIMLPRQSLIDLLPEAEDMVGQKLSSASAKISAELLLSIARSAGKLNPAEADMVSTQAISLLANTYRVSDMNPLSNPIGPLKQVKFYLYEQLSNADLTLNSIAAAHKMSVRSLQRLFYNEPHSVTEYLLYLRLKHAYRLLSNSDNRQSILDIACASGFKNASHFSRVFKQAYGQTPMEVRKQHAQP